MEELIEKQEQRQVLKWNFNYEFKGEQHSRTKFIVYEIKNIISQKYYIGQTRRELRFRWSNYKSDLLKPIQKERKIHSNIKLKKSVQKHYKETGNVDFLEFSIIEVVDVSNLSTDEEKQNLLDQREIFNIKKYKEQYGKKKVCNVRDGGRNYIHTEEDKKTISEKLKAYFQTPEGKEQRQKDSESKKNKTYEERFGEEKANIIKEKQSKALCGENHPMFGKQFSEEAKEKMSKSHIGIQAKENHPNWGKHHSEETRIKIGEASKGRKHSEETKMNMNNSRQGHIVTEETKKKIKEAQIKIYDLTSNPIVSPMGEKILKITCLKDFCKENNLQPQNLGKVLSGKRLSHKGWKMFFNKQAATS